MFFIKGEEEIADKMANRCLNEKLKQMSWIGGLSVGKD